MSTDPKMASVKLVKMAVLLLTLLSLLEFSSGIEYSDLVAINATCSPRDTCRSSGKGPRLDDPYDWKSRNCFCDDVCTDYGDCCLDANAYTEQQQIINRGNYECVSLTQFGSLYMKGKCLADWQDNYIAEKCIGSKSYEHLDPMAEMPVTSLDSFVTYKNYYCAICNNDSNTFEIWKPRLECHSLLQYANRYRNLTEEFVAKNLQYNNKNWGVYVTENDVEVFHTCRIFPLMPQTVTHMVRNCIVMINNCSVSWEDETVRKLCHSYTAVRYNFDQAYRNIHCVLCNDILPDTTSCYNQSLGRIYFRNDFSDRSFAVLLDFSDNSGSNIVGSRSICGLGEVFDPFFKKCRNVICGRENQEYRYGRCIDMGVPDIPTSTVSTTTLKTVQDTSSPNEKIPTNTVSTITSNTVQSTSESNETLPTSTMSTTTPVIFPDVSPASTTTNKLSPLLDGRDEMEKVVAGNISSESTMESNETGVTPTVIEPVTDVSEPETNVSSTVSSIEMDDNDTLVIRKEPAHKLPCERFLLPTDEYTMNDNGTVVVEKYERIYQIHEYEPSNGGILVCILQTETEKFSRVMGWVTLVGLGISCICLVIHLIAFLIVPELRNLSGKNLASLCLVLLGAFSSFILSIFGEPGKTECIILAASMYYFFLASFCWVNVMAFDVWRTLTLATTELRVSVGGQWRKFSVYSIYGWLLPGAAVAAVLLLDVLRPDFLPPQYYPALGEYGCWFGHRKALLVFFAAPLMAIMILNIMLFILSARIIAETMESTAKMTTCSPYHNQFKLYMRLALLMGLTWISGIVAGYLQLEPIWYIFVLLNTLQGFFIFLAFTCTKKVWQSVRCGCWRRISRHRHIWVGRTASTSKLGLQSTNSNVSNVSNLSQTLNSSSAHNVTSKSLVSAS